MTHDHDEPTGNQSPTAPLPDLDVWGKARMNPDQAGIALAAASMMFYIAANELRAGLAEADSVNAPLYIAASKASIAAWDAYHAVEGPFNHEINGHCLWHPNFEITFGGQNIELSVKKRPTPEDDMAEFLQSLLRQAFPGQNVEIIPGEALRHIAALMVDDAAALMVDDAETADDDTADLPVPFPARRSVND